MSTEYQIWKKYQKDPVGFLTDCLDVRAEYVWDKMREVCEAVATNQFVCVKAGNSLSKSYTVGRLALWFLFTYSPSTVFTTAPSNVQVEDILWREIRDAHGSAKIPLGGKMLKTSLELSEKWFATGFATKADAGETEATRMLGFHNEDMLIILDEAPGVDPSIWNAIDRLVTNERVKLLVIGNPIYSNGNFVDCFKDPKFHKITISAFDTPNYKEGREVVPGLADRSFVKYVRDKFGEGSSQWKSMITGEIPDTDANSLIPFSAVEEAFSRDVILPPKKEIHRVVVWDIADGGSDLNTIWCWENGKIIDVKDLYGKTIEQAEPYVWRMVRKNGANAIVWDNDGRGRVAGGYLELSVDGNTELFPFEGSSRGCVDKDMFYNVRDEAHWVMRDVFIDGDIILPKDEFLREELLSAREETEETGGRKKQYIRIEDKKKEKKRLGRSPDKRDNVMMYCYAMKHFDLPTVSKKKDRYGSIDTAPYAFNPATC